ncbi:hypothetical protein CBS101457_001932 [Exobasidium rhododendri]|nr:hypothetical protein CBS101457_001932 [Exobasidium rhododendri]
MTNSIISNLDLGENSREDAASKYETIGDTFNPFVGDDTNNNNNNNDQSIRRGESNGRPGPMAPQDVLNQSNQFPSSSSPRSASQTFTLQPFSSQHQHVQEGSGQSSGSSIPLGADDSALDALLEAHERPSTRFDSPSSGRIQEEDQSFTSPSTKDNEHTPSTRDASFGLDPDADTSHSLQGTPFRKATSSSSQHHHHLHNQHGLGNKSVYDEGEERAPSHTTARTGAPETMKNNTSHTKTVPTSSATGMPRFLPRRTSDSGSESERSQHTSRSSEAPAPKEMQLNYAPSGSLTTAIFAKDLKWRRRSYLVIASLAINLGLPFLNGVMLGFGEIFARTIMAPWIGLAPGAININAPGQRTSNTGGAGLRFGGGGRENRSENVSIESWEVEPGYKGKGRRTV